MRVAMWLSILAAVALAILNVSCQFGPEPDVVYQMANQHIQWNTGK